MFALLLSFSDERQTRILRAAHSLEDLARLVPPARPGMRAYAAEIPDPYRSTMEHPCTASRLMRYMDSLPEAERMEIYP